MKNKKKCFWGMCFISIAVLESATANMTEAGSTQLGGFEIEIGPKEEFSPDFQEPVEEQSPGHEERSELRTDTRGTGRRGKYGFFEGRRETK